MVDFGLFRGFVTSINDFLTGQNTENEGCFKLMTVEDGTGTIVNFVVAPDTYVVDQAIIDVGDRITGYYDRNAPVPLIFPPQYRALVMVKEIPGVNVKADFFNSQLVSSDGLLQVNLTPYTPILLANGQPFTGNPANRNLIVIYGPSTRSIPAQTVPYRIIVWCSV
ncbi:hypothetical protein K8O68_05415 [Salipaludibacillus sp. CUR1]|uniref:hypothetical protein n=1 Tax=Salipaludibacillus sp. CUR1 TaxID=2820003 RepID=UPI001E502728|nr:hypothetical protein [Salipaludibacillus sp. CUR1]MCE7791857.1 hypothetical protein [Salipaludibacillus sp. CUR1]